VELVAVVGIIGLRILSISIHGFDKAPFFTKAVNILQVSAINMSLISNLSSTGVVGIATWFVFFFTVQKSWI
jgi:hypothetical protein